MNDFSHLKNKLLAEQIEDQIYHYILDTPQFIESVARMAPVDMFPNSEHIEVVGSLSWAGMVLYNKS